MPWLIDGSNLLGALGADRHDDESKRALVRKLGSFARAARTRVTCVFDGEEPPSFAKQLGAITVAFSGPRQADDLIADRAARAKGWRVVTSDRALAARIQRRGVEVTTAPAFLRELEQSTSAEPPQERDWAEWFADPKNRSKF